MGVDHTVRDSPESYIYRLGQISGSMILAQWKPQCHDVRVMPLEYGQPMLTCSDYDRLTLLRLRKINWKLQLGFLYRGQSYEN